MMPLVTIVVPSYNNGKYLAEALESVLIQSYPEKEIIVVDDGSTDDSLSVLDLYRSQIRLISTPHFGASAARNTGILAANGEFISLLDSDDVWLPDKLNEQVRHLIEGGFDLVYCGGVEFGQGIIEPKRYLPKHQGDCKSAFRENPTSGIITLGCSSAIFRRSLVANSGLFDVHFQNASEDWDFFRRYCDHAKVSYISGDFVLYRQHPNNLSRSSIDAYYEGNTRALIKLIMESPDLSFLRRRRVWAHMQVLYFKTFLRRGEGVKALKCLSRIVTPMC